MGEDASKYGYLSDMELVSLVLCKNVFILFCLFIFFLARHSSRTQCVFLGFMNMAGFLFKSAKNFPRAGCDCAHTKKC
jgi:hypothetical protein